MTRERMIKIAGAAALLLVLAACSKSSSSSSAAAGDGGGSAAVVNLATTSLGSTLVDGTGRTLYLFENDTSSTSTCTGGCAGTWPALTTSGAPTAGSGVDASMLGTTARDDGTTQVTYNGHPVYRYAGDSAAGDTKGEGIGGTWFAVSPSGDKIAAAGATGPTGTSGGGHGSY